MSKSQPWPLPRVASILALDLATLTGFSMISRAPGNLYHPSDVVSGTWTLATAKELTKMRKTARHFDPRPGALFAKIVGALSGPGAEEVPTLIVWEDVEFVFSGAQITLWAGLRGALWSASELLGRRGVGMNHLSVPVGTLKKFATGHGGATKGAMALAAVAAGLVDADHDLDDNGIDARWLLEYALRNY